MKTAPLLVIVAAAGALVITRVTKTPAPIARGPAGSGPVIVSDQSELAQRSVLIYRDDRPVCSGFVDDKGDVVTAAHCFYSGPKAGNPDLHTFRLQFGAEDLGAKTGRAIQSVRLPQIFADTYNSENGVRNGDVAVIKVAGALPAIAKKTPIASPGDVQAGDKLTVGGFGYNPEQKIDSGGNAIGVLRGTTTTVAGVNQANHMVLTSQEGGHLLCHGDSGAGVFSLKGGIYNAVAVDSATVTTDFAYEKMPEKTPEQRHEKFMASCRASGQNRLTDLSAYKDWILNDPGTNQVSFNADDAGSAKAPRTPVRASSGQQ